MQGPGYSSPRPSGPFSTLCLLQAALRNEVTSFPGNVSPGQKTGLLPLAIKAMHPPGSGFHYCDVNSVGVQDAPGIL